MPAGMFSVIASSPVLYVWCSIVVSAVADAFMLWMPGVNVDVFQRMLYVMYSVVLQSLLLSPYP